MLRIVLVSLGFLLSSCSSTDVADNSDVAVTALTLGINKVGEAYNENQAPPADKFKRVFTKINGQIILSEKCFMSNNPYIVELKRPQTTKTDLFSKVDSEKLVYKIEGRTFDGEYELQLVNLRTGETIESKKLRIDSQNDKFIVNFNGCL